ncbi:MAG: T9SS type A sorting domain-containing protein [Flavobacteriales bacterium]|nr:T9SS type A sorting domain-containing protein [Flavobacteriales bacterium]
MLNSNNLNNTVATSDISYIEFSITADGSHALSLTSLSFFRQASATAPNSLIVSYSTDPLAANFNSTRVDMATSITPTSGTVLTWTFPSTITTGLGGKVTFRFYPFGTQRADGAATPPAAATGTFRLDDVSLYGAITPSITVDQTGFNGAFGNILVGNSSLSSAFTVRGDGLTNDLLITPPLGFEVRTGVNPFGTTPINLGSGDVSTTTIDVRFTPLAAVGYSDNVVCSSIGATSQDVAVSGTGIAPDPPTQLVITFINGGNNVIENTAFTLMVEAQDGSNNPQNVAADTDVQVVLNTGGGTLGGTLTGTILAGTSSVLLTGITYDIPDFGVVVDVQRTSGDVLTTATSDPFDVLGAAADFSFTSTPVGGVVNLPVGAIEVAALRATDFSVATEFTGPITISVFSGSGNMLGTLTQNAVSGVATFTGISFDQADTYLLQATGSLNSSISPGIIITSPPTMTELVVPRFIGSRSSGSANNTRTAIAVCLQFDDLLPNESYKLLLGMDTLGASTTTMGAGTWWNGTDFATSTFNNAFSTDGSGSSGPVWLYLEPTANGRFEAGKTLQVKVKHARQADSFPAGAPTFTGSKTFLALDLPSTARTVSTADDGAYLTGRTPLCVGGSYVLSYDNTAGTGDPMSSWQVRQATATTSISPTDNLLGHPAAVRSILAQISPSVVGDYALVIPIGANNPNGVRRIELRDAQNNVVSAITDADGMWPGGANTTTNARRSVVTLGLLDGALADDADEDYVCDGDDNCPDDANAGQEDGDSDGVGDACDLCPNLADAEPGDPCDDGDGDTVLDVIGAGPACGCAGVPCDVDLDFVYQADGTHTLTFAIYQQGTNALVSSGGGNLVGDGSEATCAPNNGCYYLVVEDGGSDGIVAGGYKLQINSAQILIDNSHDAYGNGGFTSGQFSQIAGDEGFCLPIGTDRLIFANCGKLDWRTACGSEYMVANANQDVSDEYGVTNGTSGYQMWWYNPNGGYSFKRTQYHSTPNGLAPSMTRACHFKLNSWGGNQLQQNVVYNAKVRGIVNNNFATAAWGPACRMMVDNTAADCPRTKLNNIPGDPYLSCGQTRTVGNNVLVHALPVRRRMAPGCTLENAKRYMFRFRTDNNNPLLTVVKVANTYFVNTSGLICGATYDVDVRASFDGGTNWCAPNGATPWGDVCLLTISCPPPPEIGGNQNMAQEGTTDLRMYPNPNRGDQLMLSLESVAEGVQTVSVDILDAFGKRVIARTIAVQDGFINTVLELNGELAAGMYMVNITAGEQVYTERMVIQP